MTTDVRSSSPVGASSSTSGGGSGRSKSGLDPRILAAYVLVAALMAYLVIEYARNVRPAVQRELAGACAALSPTPFNPALGKLPVMAPELKAQDYTGQERLLSAYRGRVVFLNFWATWCPPCVDEMPAMEKLQKGFAGEPFTILALASAKEWPKVREFFPGGTSMTVLLDPPAGDDEAGVGEKSRSWGTTKLPETYLIDKKGQIRYYFVNQRDWKSAQAQQCIRSLLDE